MISFKLILVCSYSIVIAVIIGLIRFREINRAYQPFIYITIAALLNEILSTLLIHYQKSNAISVNILNLAEWILWLWQFEKWGGFSNTTRRKFHVLAASVAGVWVIENIVIGRIFIFSSVFSVLSSFLLVFFAINQVNKLILEEKNNLLKNAKFLICTGVLVFHTYKIMVESFYVMKLDESNTFLSNIFIILVFVNLFVNLLYALATLWIPTRQKFTMQY